jgi:signal transduction histidine kinase
MEQFARQTRLLRYACIAMIVAAGMRAGYTAYFEPATASMTPHWAIKWAAAYAVFVASYAMMPAGGFTTMTARQGWLAALQAVSAITLVWLYPSFIVTCVLVVVAWQFALLLDFKRAVAAAAAQIIALAMIKCTDESAATLALIIVTCGGFQLFAVGAAQLLRSEIATREELARANAELKATQALLDESARQGERVRIARDLHDVMGHTLTTLTIHLDVASRLTSGSAAEHVACARTASGELLEQVRTVVSRFRKIQPTNLHAALERLAESAQGVLKVSLRLPPELAVSDPARAETVIRCVQEVITNAIRHANARELVIEVRNAGTGIVITARDDGRGGEFSPGSGLAGMKERFESFGGSLSVRSMQGKGFSIEGILPLLGSMP